jgi:hypothetical protein
VREHVLEIERGGTLKNVKKEKVGQEKEECD